MAVSEHWFKEGADGEPSRVDVITVECLLKAVVNNEIGLPSLQRGSAWDPAQKIILWDSILRGFPIGSLMLFDSDVRSLDPDAMRPLLGRENGEFKWLILDGQQRCATIALARPSKEKMSERLWVDLDKICSGEGDPSSQDVFYITTIAQPWGVGATEKEKREKGRDKLKELMGDNPTKACRKVDNSQRRDKQIGKGTFWRYPDPWLDLCNTWPVKAKKPVPLDALLSEDDTCKNNVKNKIPTISCALEDSHTEKLEKFRKRLLDYPLALINVDIKSETNLEDAVIDRIEKIFSRINRQGTPVSDAELFFTAIKRRFSKAHEYVEDIHSCRESGRVLTPVQIIHLEARLARSQDGPKKNGDSETLEDLPKLSRNRYEHLVREKSENDFLDKLERRIQKDGDLGGDKQHLHEALINVRSALAYQPQNVEEDIGLPLPLLANLDWSVWHTLVGWMARQNSEVGDKDRHRMIRFALMYHFFMASSAEGGIREPFKMARCREQNKFPYGDIYKWLNDEGYLFSYAAYHDKGESKKGVLPVEFYEEYARASEAWILKRYNDRDLLFWSQRHWINKWFDDFYDPLHHARADDAPFEFDHIVPQDSFKYAKGNCEQANNIKDSVGNLRIWPKELNRSEGKKSLKDRHLIGEEKLDNEAYEFWELKSNKEIREASQFPDDADDTDEASAWKKYDEVTDPGNHKKWCSKRAEAFIEAVNARRCRLYKELHDKVLNNANGC